MHSRRVPALPPAGGGCAVMRDVVELPCPAIARAHDSVVPEGDLARAVQPGANPDHRRRTEVVKVELLGAVPDYADRFAGELREPCRFRGLWSTALAAKAGPDIGRNDAHVLLRKA